LFFQTSQSRLAQEKLAELEKGSAPFEDQLHEAAKFIGIDLEDISRSISGVFDLKEEPDASTYHGREEWLLIWLLKKLQAPKDNTPRYERF
jgi:nucleolar pre-ribosomal-associated protein 2